MSHRALLEMDYITSLEFEFKGAGGVSSSPAKVLSYLPFDKIANRNPWYDKMWGGGGGGGLRRRWKVGFFAHKCAEFPKSDFG